MIRGAVGACIAVLVVVVGALGQSCATQAFFASPETGGDAQSILLQSIDGAADTLDIAVSSFTDDELGAAVIRAHRRGVSVRVILAGGREEEIGTEYQRFLSAGIAVKIGDSSASFAHQFAVVDQRIVLTGSYEWANPVGMQTYSNLLRITCPQSASDTAVQNYRTEFDELWESLPSGLAASSITASTEFYFLVRILSVDRTSQCIHLLNLSEQPIDLCDWVLSDLEGQYTFPCEDEASVIRPGEAFRVCLDELDPICIIGDLYLELEKDEVFLVTPEGELIDEVVW